MKQHGKTRAGKVCILIIFILEMLVILYQALNLDYATIDSTVALIEDARVFMTIICISFMVAAFRSSPKAYRLAAICVVDIALVNHLYSDEKLLSIWKHLKSLDTGLLIFSIVAIGGVAFFVYQAITEKKGMEKTEQNEYNVGQINIMPKHENEDKKEKNPSSVSKKIEKEQRATSKQNTPPKTNVPVIMVYMFCGGVIVWGILDYLIFNLFPIKIGRPHFLNWLPDYLYYTAIVCAVVMIVSLLARMIMKCIKNGQKPQFNDLFKISAFFSIIGEICFFVFADKIDPSFVTEWFLSSVADNVFMVLLVPIIVFVILQILVILFLNFLGLGDSSDVADDIKTRVKRIEQGMIKIAFGIIEGCVDLFSFIPSFFDTIGFLLLGEEKKEDKK